MANKLMKTIMEGRLAEGALIERACQLAYQGLTPVEIAERLKISMVQFYKYVFDNTKFYTAYVESVPLQEEMVRMKKIATPPRKRRVEAAVVVDTIEDEEQTVADAQSAIENMLNEIEFGEEDNEDE